MREIDEAVRQDDTKEFFQKYGVPLGLAISLLLASLTWKCTRGCSRW